MLSNFFTALKDNLQKIGTVKAIILAIIVLALPSFISFGIILLYGLYILYRASKIK